MSSQGINSSSLPSASSPAATTMTFLPRPDRVNHVHDPNNAQGLYPPDALLFVANLSTQRSIEQLQLACEGVFGSYGPNHTKVKHDKNGHPYAFVQFHNVQDANAAVEGSKDLWLSGRKIRIEFAKAERAVVLSRIDGHAISVNEAMKQLEVYGAIEACKPANAVSAQNPAGSVWAKFAFWADSRDALRGMQGSAQYNLTMAQPIPTETPIRWGPSNTNRGYVVNSRTNIDSKSIFVGNLPDGSTRQELEEMFGEFGQIVQVNIIRKEFGPDAINVFSFIEFETAEEANSAHSSEKEFVLGTSRLRVEPKEYSARRHRFGNGASNTPFLRSLSSVPPRQGAGQGMWRDTRNAGGPGGRQFTGWGSEYYGNRHHHSQMSSSMTGMSSYQANMHGPAYLTPPSSTLHGSGGSGTMYSASPYMQSSANAPFANPLFNPGQYTMGPILETEEHY